MASKHLRDDRKRSRFNLVLVATHAQTNAITPSGSSIGGAATTFAVDDEVAIVGVVRDGTAVATAVAARQVANLDGPPMDAV